MLKISISAIGAGLLIASTNGGATNLIPSFLPNNSYKLAQNNLNSANLEAQVFQQINQYRVSQKLGTLTRNPSIDTQARIHSQNMASGKVPFSHQDFDKRVKAINITYRAVAENVAYNQGVQDPASTAVRGWLKSPGHLRNIRGDYNLNGIGVAINNKGEIFFTQIFLKSR
ncbi:alkaline-shock protein [Cylindrospermopsis raciborskii CENA303]|uniref:Alkaline-shock protein n=1 Tax=Cylindrospermopsis raciborskii CENA303 TaxID=1170769 RepID=A0A1X4GJL2_9CYAN|nr:CAP domain-containing protein [Cylindrospermopsis raciborskii]EFA72355.1 Allergen V5/Tpx-1 related [Raphidiopsis brookii D9]OSO97250.1 alkaline-shock protein [Cylindrospermopsis raciborskii CENA303]